MPSEVHREEVQRLLREGAQLVEVISAQQYAKAHITGAISLPLVTLDHQTAQQLRPDQPIITYCADYQ